MRRGTLPVLLAALLRAGCGGARSHGIGTRVPGLDPFKGSDRNRAVKRMPVAVDGDKLAFGGAGTSRCS